MSPLIVDRYIGDRYSDAMARTSSFDLAKGSRNAGTAFLILSSLADGEKHGYALTKDVESFADVRLAPGTLYEALARLETQGLIEPVPSEDRRRPYRLTGSGAAALKEHVNLQAKVLAESQRRLNRNWSPA